MTFVRPKARILELTTTAGNGPYTLAGSPDASYNDFASFLANGDSTYASVVEPGVAFWTGIVTYNAGVITLTTVEESKGSFGGGTKEIFAGQLASRSMYAEDAAGAIVTGGTSTAYTVVSHRGYDSLSQLHNQVIAFTPHAANGQTTTLNVDGLGAKPLRPRPGFELQSNALIAGTPYTALYNHTDQVFYLHAFGGSDAPGIPLGCCIDYFGATAPSTAFALAYGQALSRITYAALWSLFGTTYGAGDGSTTFNIPDLQGRVTAGKDNMSGSPAGRLTATHFGTAATVLGAAGGNESHTLSTPEIPSHTHINTLTDPGHAHSYTQPSNGVGTGTTQNYFQSFANPATTGSSTTGITITNAAVGGGGAHKNVQPTLIANKLIRVL